MRSIFHLSTLLFVAVFCLMAFAPSVKAQDSFDDCVHYNSSCLPGSVCACQHGGMCVAPDNTTCRCDTNNTFYAGYYCETPKCFGLGPKECNTGTCVAANVCNCTTAGWQGDDCSEPICDYECVHGNCTGPDTCTCDFGYAGSTCEDEENECMRAYKPCDNHTVCTNLTPAEGGYRCSDCPSNYTGSPYLFYNTTQNGTNYIIRGGCVPIGVTSTLPSDYSTSQAPSLAPTSSNSGSSATSSQTTTTSSVTTSSSLTSSSASGSASSSGSSASRSSSSSSSNNITFESATGTPVLTVVDSSSSMLLVSSFAVLLLSLTM